MNRRRCLGMLVVVAGSLTACRSLQADARFQTAAELTATAQDPSERPTGTTDQPLATVTPPNPTPARAPTPRASPEPSPTSSGQPGEATPTPSLGKLAFVRGGDVWVKDLPEGDERRLTQDGANASPRWSPSGGWLTFARGQQVWITRSNGLDAHPADNLSASEAAWSPRADRLAYLAGGGLVVTSADGSGRKQLIAPPGNPPSSAITALAWSPDGAWIAFEKLERATAGENQPPRVLAQGIWRVKADGTETQPVYVNADPFATQSYLADWSPDGRLVLFWRGMQMSASLGMDGGPLLAVPLTGAAPTELTSQMLMHPDFLSWAPDSQRLALVAGGGRSTWDHKAIAVITIGGATQTRTDSSQSALFPAWSPDGRWIAYTAAPGVDTDGGDPAADASRKRHLWRMEPDGQNKQALTNDARFHDEYPQWSGDGSSLLFARLDDAHAQLWLMEADGSDQRVVVNELTPRPEGLGTYGYIDWGRLYDWWVPGVQAPRAAE